MSIIFYLNIINRGKILLTSAKTILSIKTPTLNVSFLLDGYLALHRLTSSHLSDLPDLSNQYLLYDIGDRRWCWTPRPDCLSDSLHSAVKSESISFTKLQISTEYYQQLAVKNDQPREIKHYFCHLQEGKSRGEESEPPCFLIVFIEEVRFIYSPSLGR